eukprot:857477-Pleurochrysis_carterae.AAC.1
MSWRAGVSVYGWYSRWWHRGRRGSRPSIAIADVGWWRRAQRFRCEVRVEKRSQYACNEKTDIWWVCSVCARAPCVSLLGPPRNVNLLRMLATEMR